MQHDHCVFCNSSPTQDCHVKDKSTFTEENLLHRFNNIIKLCNNCHYNYFDARRLAILDQNHFIRLECIQTGETKVYRTYKTLGIDKDYIDWKNSNCHICLRTALLRHKKTLLNSTSDAQRYKK